MLLVFDVPYQPRVKWMPEKSSNYLKLVKDASNFYGSHFDGIVCVKQIDLGSARTLNKY